MSPWVRQAAAIPIRDGRVCLVNSSNGRRWVVPKGAIEPGRTAGETALVETWEEAGLVGTLAPEPVGSYVYHKNGAPHHVVVFLMNVSDVLADWPERGHRQRLWLPFADAVERVSEAALRDVLATALVGLAEPVAS